MLKVLELFAGIGACSKALDRIGIEHEIVDAVEIDKYAITSFNAIHGTNFDVQDITEWDKDIDVDLIMHGSPCQDFSVAGKQAGGDVGSGTRSSLMYETIRIVGKLRPKYVVWENVKNLLSKKHKHNFDAYIETMNILGYNSYYQVLNAKDYGIPQNRERVFTVSIRKDIDKGTFTFPEKEPLELRLKDMLEEQVDEKYYLSDMQVNKIQTSDFMQEKKRIQEKDYFDTILARDWKDPKCVRIGNIYGEDKGTGYAGNVWDKENLSPTLTNMQGGNRQPMILEEPQLITHNIQQTVKVRKYAVNIEKLKEQLRNAKLEQDLNNRQIAEILDIPQTQVEHYFRTDSSFAIPSPEIWLKLKEILGITTNEFDESIMTFEEKEGVYEKANRIYDEQGLAPTLTQQEEKILVKNATQKGYDEAIDGNSINLSYPESTTRRGRVGHGVAQTLQCNDSMGVVEAEIKVLGNYMPSNHDASRIVDSDGLAPTVKENHGTVTAIIEEKILVKNATQKGYDEAIDGDSINLSYPESTTRRGRVGHGVSQTLQCNDSMGVVETKLPGAYGRNYGSKGKIQDAENICDTLQAAMGNGGGNVPILEEPAIQVGNYMPSNHDASRIVDSEGLAPTVKENHGTVTATNCGLRIRKLTPKECYRLMGFDDSDFEKAKNALNEKFYKGKDKSSSQLYKQAGNSIVVNVLEKIFKNLLEEEK